MSYSSDIAPTVATTQPLPWVYNKDIGVRVVSGASSALSILGSALIILTYVCFHSLRTRARLFLVHLALSDMGVGLANLIGIIANFDSFYSHSPSPGMTGPYQPNISIVVLCETQAFVAEYCTLSSVLWTTCLAVYMYMLIMSHEPKLTKLFLWFSYLFCYGTPLLVTVWMMATGRLGYAPYNSAGWCSLIAVKPFVEHEILVPKVDLVSNIIGYDLWICLTIVLIVVLYISVFSYVRLQVRVVCYKCVTNKSSLFSLQYNELKDDADAMEYWQAMYNIDYKFIAIPLMFIFLRIWTVILNILIIYIQITVSPVILKALLYMGVSHC